MMRINVEVPDKHWKTQGEREREGDQRSIWRNGVNKVVRKT